METATRAARRDFASKLRVAIDEKGVSVRSLSRQLNPLSPETARSNLMRWLRGAHRPSRTSRRAVAVALGLAPDYFESDDDEESDQMSLDDFLRALIQQLTREALKELA